MTDYAQITTFTTKDSLTTGNPAKAVKGSELDAELSAISVAIISKFDTADLADQATAEAGANNTTLVTPLRVAQELAALSQTTAKYKTASETVNNSTTLQDDDHIASFTIAASGVYRVHGVLHCSIKQASDIKLCLTLASAPTSLNILFIGVGPTATVRAVQVTSGTAVALTDTADENYIILIDGIIVNDTDLTTAKLQWAQNAAVSENTVLNIGSFIELTKIA